MNLDFANVLIINILHQNALFGKSPSNVYKNIILLRNKKQSLINYNSFLQHIY